MSIFQAWIAPGRALVAVDTNGYKSNGGQSEMQKLAVMPLSNAVMACRGSQLAFFQVLAQAWLVPGHNSYDKLAAGLPQLIEWAAAQFPPSLPDDAAQCELHLVGWSDAQQKMAGVSFTFNLKAKTAEPVGEIRRNRIGPASNTQTPEQFDDDVAMRLARHQLAWLEENAPAEVTGGRLLVAEIRRGRIETRDVGPI